MTSFTGTGLHTTHTGGTLGPKIGEILLPVGNSGKPPQVQVVFVHVREMLKKMTPPSAQEVFGHIESVEILVILNPAGYMLTSSGFASFT